jgi:hypothetical protein
LKENAPHDLFGVLASVRRGLLERCDWRIVPKDAVWDPKLIQSNAGGRFFIHKFSLL